jgi:acyl-CoA synthetase (AMP-forming)/AMP-acid ligase II
MVRRSRLRMTQAMVNIARYLPEQASKLGDAIAVIESKHEKGGRINPKARISFAELDRKINRIANSLESAGIRRGMRTMVMVKPSIDFIAIAFALFKMGAIPLLIDPGMGRKNFLYAVQDVKPEAFVGIGLANVLRLIFRKSFSSVKTVVTVGRRWFWGGHSLRILTKSASDGFSMAETSAEETAAILFTTGSTGPAKGAVYTHGVFVAQTEIIAKEWGIGSADVDYPIFPLFALFSTALGARVVIPDMNPSRPALVEGKKMYEALKHYDVSFSFGSPAFWNRVAGYCHDESKRLGRLRRVLMAGAPIPRSLVEAMNSVLSSAEQLGIPYGATESLPVSWISGLEVLDSTGVATEAGAGYCVGLPLDVNTVKIIAIEDGLISDFSEIEELAQGEIGEILVSGPVVTTSYFGRDEATALAKIHEGAKVWHRMGDLGYFDAQGRLWFCGRKAHRVETKVGRLYSVRTEAIFNAHPRVFRSALVGVQLGAVIEAVIVIECISDLAPKNKVEQSLLRDELLDLGAQSELTSEICKVLFHRAFPVDIRHNAKIFREKLAIWAAQELN